MVTSYAFKGRVHFQTIPTPAILWPHRADVSPDLPTVTDYFKYVLCFVAIGFLTSPYICHRDIYYRIDVTFYDKMVLGDQGIIITLNQKMTYKQVCAWPTYPSSVTYMSLISDPHTPHQWPTCPSSVTHMTLVSDPHTPHQSPPQNVTLPFAVSPSDGSGCGPSFEYRSSLVAILQTSTVSKEGVGWVGILFLGGGCMEEEQGMVHWGEGVEVVGHVVRVWR